MPLVREGLVPHEEDVVGQPTNTAIRSFDSLGDSQTFPHLHAQTEVSRGGALRVDDEGTEIR